MDGPGDQPAASPRPLSAFSSGNIRDHAYAPTAARSCQLSSAAPSHGNERDAIAEPVSPASPPTPPRAYQLTTKQGTTTFQTGEEWLAAWAKLVRGCKAARALDKLQTARQTNQAHIAAVAAFDPEPAATLTAQLDRALSVARQDA